MFMSLYLQLLILYYLDRLSILNTIGMAEWPIKLLITNGFSVYVLSLTNYISLKYQLQAQYELFTRTVI